MSTTVTETKRLEQVEDGPYADVLEMTSAVAERLSYFRRIAMRRLNSVDDAEDAVQDALLAAWKHLDQFRGQARMSTWLTAIVINASRQMVRKASRVRLLPIDGQENGENNVSYSELLPDRRPDPEAQLCKSEYERRLHDLSARLPPALRVVFQMQIVEGRGGAFEKWRRLSA